MYAALYILSTKKCLITAEKFKYLCILMVLRMDIHCTCKLLSLSCATLFAYSTCENICKAVVFPYSVPELSFIEPQGLTSDHVKELTEEVEKLAKENVGEVHMHVRRKRGERAWQ